MTAEDIEKQFSNPNPTLINQTKALVLEQPEVLGTFFEVFYISPFRVSHHIGNAILACIQEDAALIRPYLSKMVTELQQDPPIWVQRQLLRILNQITIPVEHQGVMFELCFELFGNPMEPIAIRHYSLGILYSIVKEIPELGHELKLVLEEHMPYLSRGVAQKGRKILAKL